MSLLRRTSAGIARLSLNSRDIGLDCFLCCPGPSLVDVPPAPGVIRFAVNTAYPTVRPDVWVGVDHPGAYDPRLWWEPFVKIMRSGTHTRVVGGRYLGESPMTFFADHMRRPSADILKDLGPHVRFCYNANVFFFALHIMLWMGARRIRFVGCDMSNEKADYCTGNTLTPEQRVNNAKLYAAETQTLRELKPQFDAAGIELVNCTPDSPLGDFLPSRPLGEALTEAVERTPQPFVKQPLHGKDAYETQWALIVAPAGIVVGVAPDQADLLPWWWARYSKHNDLPVAFADFGMGERWREWCAERGRVVGVRNAPAVGWFRKPFAILRAGFGRVLWLDLDTECRGSVRPLLEFCRDGQIGLGADRIAEKHKADRRVPMDTTMYDTGVIAVAHGDTLVPEWAAGCVRNERGVRGDQEVLCMLLAHRGRQVRAFGGDLHGICFPGWDVPDAVVRHWVGPPGKQYIRQQRAEPRPGWPPQGWQPLAPDAPPAGVVTGCDRALEWMLPWWLGNLRRANPRLPVAFCDFGLSPKMRAWCAKHGHVIDAGPVDVFPGHNQPKHVWWRKPFCILSAPFKRILWLDQDVEVRKDLRPLFDHGPRVAGAFDLLATIRFGAPIRARIYNAGVLACHHGEPLIPMWAAAVSKGHPLGSNGGFYCDQTALNCLGERHGRMAEMPPEQAWICYKGEYEKLKGQDPAVVHYVGQTGKEYIRQCIARSEHSAAPKRAAPAQAAIAAVDSRLSRHGVGMGQNRGDIAWLFKKVQATGAQTLIEIGSEYGGSVGVLARAMPVGSKVICVDMPNIGGGHADSPDILREGLAELRSAGYDVTLIANNSHSPSAVQAVGSALGRGRLADVLFIDGDHEYEGVRQDWLEYRGFVRPGGLVAFHDINALRPQRGGSAAFWNTLRQGYDAAQCMANSRAPGIGLLVLPDGPVAADTAGIIPERLHVMMISDRHKFVFISTPKCATHTMYEFLQRYGAQRREGAFHHVHVPKRYADYCLWTVVRNPYARAVSIWWYLLHTDTPMGQGRRLLWQNMIGGDSLEEFLRWLTTQPLPMRRANLALIPQHGWLRDVGLTAVLHLERLREELLVLPFVSETDLADLPHIDSDNRHLSQAAYGDWREHMTDELAELVREWAGGDFARFGYSTDWDSGE